MTEITDEQRREVLVRFGIVNEIPAMSNEIRRAFDALVDALVRAERKAQEVDEAYARAHGWMDDEDDED